MRTLIAIVAGWLLVLCTAAASAYINLPVLSPEDPQAGQQVAILIRAGFCDGFPGAVDSAVVTQAGNNIRVLLESNHEEDSFCVLPPVSDYRFTIGAFYSGTYSVQVNRWYTPQVGPVITETLAVLTMEVSGGLGAASVPTISIAMGSILLLSLIWLARSHLVHRNIFGAFLCIAFLNALPNTAYAQIDSRKYVQMLQSSEPGAPTPEEVVSFSFASRDTPPFGKCL
ncbi:MAG: hypothetical protein ABI411_04845 [Tahibacter sp.]